MDKEKYEVIHLYICHLFSWKLNECSLCVYLFLWILIILVVYDLTRNVCMEVAVPINMVQDTNN